MYECQYECGTSVCTFCMTEQEFGMQHEEICNKQHGGSEEDDQDEDMPPIDD